MLKIEKCGPLTTIQDKGRPGFKRIGVGCGGPYDQLAYTAGQLLLRDENKPSIEMLFYPFRVTFLAEMTIAVTGAANTLKLDDEPHLAWSRFSVKAGQTLTISQPSAGHGMATYLSVSSGIISDEVLGSAAADLKARFSGLCGREIRAGDTFPVAAQHVQLSELGLDPEQMFIGAQSEIGFVPGFEFHDLADWNEANFSKLSWRISSRSNKIGCRLEGNSLRLRSKVELLSYGLVSGLIQLPPDGTPVVLMAEAQTMGGYPRLGFIPDPELSKLARHELGATVSLVPIDVSTAELNYAKQQTLLHKIKSFSEIY